MPDNGKPMKIDRLCDALGAEVRGVDLARLDDAAGAAIRDAFHDHLVLVAHFHMLGLAVLTRDLVLHREAEGLLVELDRGLGIHNSESRRKPRKVFRLGGSVGHGDSSSGMG